MAAKIKANPKNVKSLSAPTLSGTTLTGKWKKTSDQTNSKKSYRTEWFTAEWTFGFKAKKGTKTLTKKGVEKTTLHATVSKQNPFPKGYKGKKGFKTPGPKTQKGHAAVRVHKIKTDLTELKQKFNRKAYYPFLRSKGTYRYLTKVTMTLWSSNSFKNGNKDGALSSGKKKSLKIIKPDKPKLSGITFDTTKRQWSCTATAAKKEDATTKGFKERYDTLYWAQIKRNYGNNKNQWLSAISKVVDPKDSKATSFTGDSKNITGYINDIDTITTSQYVAVQVFAQSRGLAGSSATKKSSVRYFSYPPKPSITGVTCTPEKRDKATDDTDTVPAGRIVVSINTHATTEHPVDSVELLMLKNVTYEDADVADAASGWTSTGVKGIGKTSALADTYENAYPDAERKIWYRLKVTHDQFIRYSDPVCVTDLEHGLGVSAIEEVTVVDDGVDPTGIKMVIGMTEYGDGVEVEWSKFKNAIYSDRPPASFRQPLVRSKAETEELNQKYKKNYKYSTLCYITELEEGEKYYLDSRRYVEGSSGTIYGTRTYWRDNTKIEPVLFARKPTEVKMNVPAYVDETETEFEVSWTFDSVVKQTYYHLYALTAVRDSQGNLVRNTDGTVQVKLNSVITETTEKMYATVQSSLVKPFVENGKLQFRVAVSCGGPEAMSGNSEEVLVVRKPGVTVDISQALQGDTLTAQNPKIVYQVDQANMKVFVRVESLGIVMSYPDGDYDQAAGEVLYTGVLEPERVRENIEFALPHCDFIDGGDYLLTLTPVGSTGLQGTPATVRFRVGWEHQAHIAGPMTYAIGDSKGVTATIYTERPDNWLSSDRCDIYRVTPDGAYRIAEDVHFGRPVVDQFAPYSKRANLRYRVVTVTEDGDVDWIDVPYNIRAHGIRFDWVGSRANGKPAYHTVMLPYNVKFSDSWTKQFEKVRDLNGAAVGWWNPGVDRKATLSTDMIRLGDIENKEMVRELATHPGPVFVRTPNGCAFTANVNVTSFTDDYDSLVSAVSFDAEEIDLVPDFRVRNESEG